MEFGEIRLYLGWGTRGEKETGCAFYKGQEGGELGRGREGESCDFGFAEDHSERKGQ